MPISKKVIGRTLPQILLLLVLLSVNAFVTTADATNFDLAPSPLFFTTIKNNTSSAKDITITNTTGAAIQVTNLQLTGAAEFNYASTPSLPFTIPGNGTEIVGFKFSPTSENVFVATLAVTAGGQSDSVQLRGLGVDGTSGDNEPSLQLVLNALNIPLNVGDDDITTTKLNSNNTIASGPAFGPDEINAQLFRRANTSQPVTFEALGGFATNDSVAVSINGIYTEDTPGDKQEAFRVQTGSHQTLIPITTGTGSVVPASTNFGIYSIYPTFLTGGDRLVYSQDGFNDWESDVQERHKIRVYPYPGEANAYLYAVEEYDQGFDYNDVIVVIRNVVPADAVEGVANIAFENRDWTTFRSYNYPNSKWFDTWLTFSAIKDQYSSNVRGMKLETVLRIRNTSTDTPLNISSMVLSAPTRWRLKNNENALVIQPENFYDLTVVYYGTDGTSGPRYGTLTINSNDPDSPVSTINLGAGFQTASEGSFELKMIDMFESFGFGTYLGFFPSKQYKVAGEEILSKYWQRKDTNKPIYMLQLGAFHGCGGTQKATLSMRRMSNNSQITFTQSGDFFCQSYFPLNGEVYGDPKAELTTSSNDPFYLRIAGNESMSAVCTPQDELNGLCTNTHGIRTWPARDRNGVLIQDVYILAQDYVTGGTATNFDFNDNFYLMTNVMPMATVPTNIYLVEEGPDTASMGQAVTLRFRALTTIMPSNNVTLNITIPNNATYLSHTNGACGVSGKVINCNFGSNFVNTQIVDVTLKADVVGEISVVGQMASSSSQSTTGDDQKTSKFTATEPNPPVASNDGPYNTTMNQVLNVSAANGVLANDTDPNNDDLTAILVTGSANGNVVLNPDGSFSYTPTINFSGETTFTYKANDGTVDSNVATVTINVSGGGVIPIANNDSYSIEENTVLEISAELGVLANDINPDDDTMTATNPSQPTNGTLMLNPNGAFTYTPDANYFGTDSFTYDATNANGSTSATVTINIASVNFPPTAVEDQYGTTVNNPIVADASAGVLSNDFDSDPNDVLSASNATTPQHGTVTLNSDGSFTYTPDTDYIGSDSFDYTVSDNNGDSDLGTVNITISENNTPPVAVDDTYTAGIDQVLTVNAAEGVLANDTDADSNVLSASLGSDVSSGTLSLQSSGAFTYTPDNGFSGADSFTYTVNDGNGGTDTATVTINVSVNVLTAVDDTYSTGTNQVLTVSAGNGVLSNDTTTSGNPLTATINDVTNASGTVVLNLDGSFSYTPDTDFNGTAIFTYTASDGAQTDSATVTITVNGDNAAPTAVADTYTAVENTQLTVSAANGVLANDTDPEGDTLSAVLVSSPTSGTLNLNGDGSFSYLPDTDFMGADTFTYRVDDSVTGDSIGTVTINVVEAALNLVVNGSFETKDATDSKLPESWVGKRITSDKVKCNKLDRPGKPDKIFSADGLCAFQFKGVAGENARLQQKVDAAAIAELQDGDTLSLYAMVKGKKVVEAAAKITVKGKNTDDEKFKITIELTEGDYEYVEVHSTDQIEGTLAKLKLQIGYNGATGKFLVDAVRLTVNDAGMPVTAPDAGTAQPDGDLLPLPLPADASSNGRGG